MISILCVCPGSNYALIPGLDLWDAKRDAYNFTGRNTVITHAPCAQWSRMKWFAKEDARSKDLAYFCFSAVKRNGGIFEHPAGSSFFRSVNANFKNIISVNQSWWGFPAQKRTYLYFEGFKPLSFPLSFDAPTANVRYMNSKMRALMPLEFCQYLVNCCSPVNCAPLGLS